MSKQVFGPDLIGTEESALQQDKAREGAVEAVQKALGTPVAAELTPHALKVRTNLIIASAISIAVAGVPLHIKDDSSLLGLKFIGVTDRAIDIGLLLITAYLAIHFAWLVVDAYSEWRLRITGTRVAFITAPKWVSGEEPDYPDDPRQSTLYNWWVDKAKVVKEQERTLYDAMATIPGWRRQIDEKLVGGFDPNNFGTLINGLSSNVAACSQTLGEVRKVIESPRIIESLRRFNGWFEFFLRSQNLRWLVVDAGAPITVAIAALLMLSLAL